HRGDPILKRERRAIDAVVFDEQFCETESSTESLGLYEGSCAGRFAHYGIAVRGQEDRQELTVAPQIFFTRLDQIASQFFCDRRVIVFDFKGCETIFATRE